MKLMFAALAAVALAGSTVCPSTATQSNPHSTYCMCPRGKFLKVVTTGTHHGYYCQLRARRVGRCSMSKRHLTFRKCRCDRPYTIAHAVKTVRGRRRTGYYCKRSRHYRDCPESAYCLFSTQGMTSRQYNTQVRNCNKNMDNTFIAVQTPSTHYCICGSNAWKRAHPTHEKYYLRYTYHAQMRGGTPVTNPNGSPVYTHGYICLPRYRHKRRTCPTNTNRGRPHRGICACPKGKRRMSRMLRRGRRRWRGYWCQSVAPCRTTNANAPSSVYCTCPKDSGSYLRYVRAACHRRRTNYHPPACNLKYKGYRIGFCFDDNRRTRDRRWGHKRNRRRTNQRGRRRNVMRRRGGRRGGRRGLANIRARRGNNRRRGRRGGYQRRGTRRNNRRGRRPRHYNRHKRAREHQCCKRVTCTDRDVGYYCNQRSRCGTASITRPSRKYCHCPRGTHLKYTRRYRGYYCERLTRCSMNRGNPTG